MPPPMLKKGRPSVKRLAENAKKCVSRETGRKEVCPVYLLVSKRWPDMQHALRLSLVHTKRDDSVSAVVEYVAAAAPSLSRILARFISSLAFFIFFLLVPLSHFCVKGKEKPTRNKKTN
jgi:hypothetical protein